MGNLSKMPRAEQWAEKIRAQIGRTVESIIETGRLLRRAKSDLPYGEWGRMFSDGLVAFGQSTADKLMAIAKHELIGDSEHVPNLPPSWGTLYELTLVPEPTLKNAIKDGVITPDMQRKDVKALLPVAPPKPETEPEEFHWLNALDDLRVVVDRATRSWPESALTDLPVALRELAAIYERDLNADRREGADCAVSDTDPGAHEHTAHASE